MGTGFQKSRTFKVSPFFVKPACDERDIVVTISVWCMCVCCACMCLSGFVQAITSTFMDEFQNNLPQLLSLRNGSAI